MSDWGRASGPGGRDERALAEGADALYQTLDRYPLADLALDERPLRLALLGEHIRPSGRQKGGGVGTKQR